MIPEYSADRQLRSPCDRSLECPLDVPLFEFEVQSRYSNLARLERDVGSQSVDLRHHLGGDEDQFGGGVESG